MELKTVDVIKDITIHFNEDTVIVGRLDPWDNRYSMIFHKHELPALLAALESAAEAMGVETEAHDALASAHIHIHWLETVIWQAMT